MVGHLGKVPAFRTLCSLPRFELLGCASMMVTGVLSSMLVRRESREVVMSEGLGQDFLVVSVVVQGR